MQGQALSNLILPELAKNMKVSLPKHRPTGTGIAHFGVGAFHRSHQAFYTQLTMNEDESQVNWGIVGVGIMPFDFKMNQILKKQDYMFSLVEKSPSEEVAYTIVNSITDHIYAAEDISELLEKVCG